MIMIESKNSQHQPLRPHTATLPLLIYYMSTNYEQKHYMIQIFFRLNISIYSYQKTVEHKNGLWCMAKTNSTNEVL